MATTALRIDGKNLKFMTVQLETHVDVDVYLCDNQFIPHGEPERGLCNMATEEIYHKSLRENAIEKGHYVPEQSTNPEWDNSGVKEYTLEDLLREEYGEKGTPKRDEFEEYYKQMKERDDLEGQIFDPE